MSNSAVWSPRKYDSCPRQPGGGMSFCVHMNFWCAPFELVKLHLSTAVGCGQHVSTALKMRQDHEFDRLTYHIVTRYRTFSLLSFTIEQMVAVTATGISAAGWYCKVCDCTLKDSLSWLDHINGRKRKFFSVFDLLDSMVWYRRCVD